MDYLENCPISFQISKSEGKVLEEKEREREIWTFEGKKERYVLRIRLKKMYSTCLNAHRTIC